MPTMVIILECPPYCMIPMDIPKIGIYAEWKALLKYVHSKRDVDCVGIIQRGSTCI